MRPVCLDWPSSRPVRLKGQYHHPESIRRAIGGAYPYGWCPSCAEWMPQHVRFGKIIVCCSCKGIITALSNVEPAHIRKAYAAKTREARILAEHTYNAALPPSAIKRPNAVGIQDLMERTRQRLVGQGAPTHA